MSQQTNDRPSIMTGKGDFGNSSTFLIHNIPKFSPIFNFLGTIDELSSNLGLARCYCDSKINQQLLKIQNILFEIAAIESTNNLPSDDLINFSKTLEIWSTELDKDLIKLNSFILPGGHISSAQIHLSRTICRRCERKYIKYISFDENRNKEKMNFIQILNRLSDYLFIVSRYQNNINKIDDIFC